MHSSQMAVMHLYERNCGESYNSAEEEAESLDQAVYQEMYDPDVQDAIKPQ